MHISSAGNNVRWTGGFVKKDSFCQAVFGVFLVANHVLLLSGQLSGRGYHLMFFAVSILLLYRTTVFMLSVSRHGQDQCSPFHQLRLWPPVGHHPMLGGFFTVLPLRARSECARAQGAGRNTADAGAAEW